MTEKLLQFIWQYKLLDFTKITNTVCGQKLEVLKVGTLNCNAGPDFENAKIKFEQTTWVGNLEMHVNASDWYKHKHDAQINYNKIIAHVVYIADAEIKDTLGNIIPCIELQKAIDVSLLQRFENLMQNSNNIACANIIKDVKPIIILQQLEKVLIQRLLQKSNSIASLLEQTTNNWTEVFYILIAKVFGGNVNGAAFEALAIRLPLKILIKHKTNILQLEALLFGVAGLMPSSNSTDIYIKELQTEFLFLQKKYSLQVMDATRFKFLRMRPQNFATIRIAQFANLICNASYLFSKVLEQHMNAKALQQLFACNTSEYWQTHYTFNASIHKATIKNNGIAHINSILINAVAPTLYVYGMQLDSKTHYNQALELLQQLPAEQNKITKLYSNLGLENNNAANSQAMLQQYKNYCSTKNCLECSIGFSILKK